MWVGSKILVNSVLHSLPKCWAQCESCQLLYQISVVTNAQPQLGYKVEVVDKHNWGIVFFFLPNFDVLTDLRAFGANILVNYVYTQFTKMLDRNFNSRFIFAFFVNKKKCSKNW